MIAAKHMPKEPIYHDDTYSYYLVVNYAERLQLADTKVFIRHIIDFAGDKVLTTLLTACIDLK